MFIRPRRPLLRTAMIGGAGYMAGKSAANSRAREADQEARLSELETQQPAAAAPAPAPAAAPAGGTDVVGKLKELKELLDAGVLDQTEFEAAKKQVLQGS